MTFTFPVGLFGSNGPASPLVSISITAPSQVPDTNSRIEVGSPDFQLVAIGTYADFSTKDITHSVVWVSDTPASLDVNASSGVVTVGVPGRPEITATKDAIVGYYDATVGTKAAIDCSLQGNGHIHGTWEFFQIGNFGNNNLVQCLPISNGGTGTYNVVASESINTGIYPAPWVTVTYECDIIGTTGATVGDLEDAINTLIYNSVKVSGNRAQVLAASPDLMNPGLYLDPPASDGIGPPGDPGVGGTAMSGGS